MISLGSDAGSQTKSPLKKKCNLNEDDVDDPFVEAEEMILKTEKAALVLERLRTESDSEYTSCDDTTGSPVRQTVAARFHGNANAASTGLDEVNKFVAHTELKRVSSSSAVEEKTDNFSQNEYGPNVPDAAKDDAPFSLDNSATVDKTNMLNSEKDDTKLNEPKTGNASELGGTAQPEFNNNKMDPKQLKTNKLPGDGADGWVEKPEIVKKMETKSLSSSTAQYEESQQTEWLPSESSTVLPNGDSPMFDASPTSPMRTLMQACVDSFQEFFAEFVSRRLLLESSILTSSTAMMTKQTDLVSQSAVEDREYIWVTEQQKHLTGVFMSACQLLMEFSCFPMYCKEHKQLYSNLQETGETDRDRSESH